MSHFLSFSFPNTIVILAGILFFISTNARSQDLPLHGRDSLNGPFPLFPFPPPDSSSRTNSKMTPLPSLKNFTESEKKRINDFFLKQQSDNLHQQRDTLHGHPSPFLQFTGGYIDYNFMYRSNLDTPYTEKNIAQHQILSTMNFLIGGMVPIRVNSFIRRSNSSIFRDINDVQVSFDAAGYRNRLAAMMRAKLTGPAPGGDSVLESLYRSRLWQTRKMGNWLKDPAIGQKLTEANEILKVPGLTYTMGQPDSVNKHREDSLRRMARLFLELYARTKGEYEKLSASTDSLKRFYDKSVENGRHYAQLAKGQFNNPSSYQQWKQELQQYAPGAGELPAKYRWLLGIRKFGLGRNTASTSELTAKNISLTGVNFEYNSWYYLGLSAGLVDYRFRDFVVSRLQGPKQYMYVIRAGLGRLEHNYFILSTFGGQKQLFNPPPGNPSYVSIPTVLRFTGISAEVRWQPVKNAWLTAEAAQSFSPDLQSGPPVTKSGWNLSDKTNKAISLKLYSWFPATATRLDAQYKFQGANYQSFNAFQSNSEQRSWYVKGEQSLFKRQLKFVASLRSNDYSNPYIVQNYKANTVFKSFNLSFHRRKLPIISVGYMPMSQLTMVGTQLSENRFQTLNASLSHFYAIGLRQASTNIVYTKFFNGSRDTGFIYYNSVNLYMGQTIFFRDFTATMAFSHSSSTGYQYNVLENNISFPVMKKLSLGLGTRINNLNRTETLVGGFVNGNLLIGKDKLFFAAEKGYLPGSGTAGKLVKNLTGNISFMKVLF